jgi:hypothetical protein
MRTRNSSYSNNLLNYSYLCIPGFLSSKDVTLLVDRIKELLNDFDIASHPMTKVKSLVKKLCMRLTVTSVYYRRRFTYR